MSRWNLKLSSAFILVTLLAIGCVKVGYVGNSVGITTSVDVYFSEEEITREYTVIGHAVGSSQFVSNDKIQERLIKGSNEQRGRCYIDIRDWGIKCHPRWQQFC